MSTPRRVVYLIGSLRNPEVPTFANALEAETGYEVFASWFAAGPEADDKWKEYERARSRTYREAIAHWAARSVFAFDKLHLDRADAAVLLLPAGRSGHLELGYTVGRGKPGFIFLDKETEEGRWDVMTQFATGMTSDMGELADMLERALG